MSENLKKLPLLMIAGTDFENREPLLDYAGVDYKALIDINGKAIITRMLEQFQNSGIISHIFIIGIPKKLVTLPDKIKNVHFVETDELMVPERIQTSSRYILNLAKKDSTVFERDDHKVLFMGADVPFITSEIIIDFYNKLDVNKDLHVSIVQEEDMNARFPNNNRTYAKFREGKFCMGDLSSFDCSMVDPRMQSITTFRENRKNFIMVILKLRPSIVFRYLFKRLTLEYAASSVDLVFDVKSQIIPMESAEIGFDIDKPEQLEIARKELI